MNLSYFLIWILSSLFYHRVALSASHLPFELDDFEIPHDFNPEEPIHIEREAPQKRYSAEVARKYHEWVLEGKPKRTRIRRNNDASKEALKGLDKFKFPGHGHHGHDHHDSESHVPGECIHDKMDSLQHKRRGSVNYGHDDVYKKIKWMKENGEINTETFRRRLAADVYEPIRIVPYFDRIDQTESAADAEWIKKLVSGSVRYFESMMNVYRVPGSLGDPPFCYSGWNVGNYFNCATGNYETDQTCGAITIPDWMKGPKMEYSYNSAATLTEADGVADADVIIFVSADNDQCGQTTLAYAGACGFDQYNRPISGHVNVCDYALNNQDWTGDIDTMVHELTHILILSFSLLGRFVDSEGNDLDNALVYQTDGNGQNWVITPTVRSEARAHYDCNSLIGLPLEDNGGSGTQNSHWEERHVLYENMNGIAWNGVHINSRFTYALMEDSGWYSVNWDQARPYHFGKNAGCSFFDAGSCPNDQYYCAGSGDTGCTYSNGIDGYCAESQLSNGCPFRSGYSNREFCWDQSGVLDASKRCIDYESGGGSTYGQCYSLTCNGWDAGSETWNDVDISVSGQIVNCNKNEIDVQKNIPSSSAKITCPDVEIVCESSTPLHCLYGHYSDDLGQCVCTMGYSGTLCDVEDDSIVQSAQHGSIERGPDSVCIQFSSNPSVDGDYSVFGTYHDFKSYKHVTNNRYLWWDSWNHFWRITNSVGSTATSFGYGDCGQYVPNVLWCSTGDWSMHVNMDINAFCGTSAAPTTGAPSDNPTQKPTKNPTKKPTKYPTTDSPTRNPTPKPTTASPTDSPTRKPTKKPTKYPTKNPLLPDETSAPSDNPTPEPTKKPTKNPTPPPTDEPTKKPSDDPTAKPTKNPLQDGQTSSPSDSPTDMPSDSPTPDPTNYPSFSPTVSPTVTQWKWFEIQIHVIFGQNSTFNLSIHLNDWCVSVRDDIINLITANISDFDGNYNMSHECSDQEEIFESSEDDNSRRRRRFQSDDESVATNVYTSTEIGTTMEIVSNPLERFLNSDKFTSDLNNLIISKNSDYRVVSVEVDAFRVTPGTTTGFDGSTEVENGGNGNGNDDDGIDLMDYQSYSIFEYMVLAVTGLGFLCLVIGCTVIYCKYLKKEKSDNSKINMNNYQVDTISGRSHMALPMGNLGTGSTYNKKKRPPPFVPSFRNEGNSGTTGTAASPRWQPRSNTGRKARPPPPRSKKAQRAHEQGVAAFNRDFQAALGTPNIVAVEDSDDAGGIDL